MRSEACGGGCERRVQAGRGRPQRRMYACARRPAPRAPRASPAHALALTLHHPAREQIHVCNTVLHICQFLPLNAHYCINTIFNKNVNLVARFFIIFHVLQYRS